jgi:hypothetical protein
MYIYVYVYICIHIYTCICIKDLHDLAFNIVGDDG